MPLYTKCFKCGGWREMPENPTEQKQIATGIMRNLPEPPPDVCSCNGDRRSAGTN